MTVHQRDSGGVENRAAKVLNVQSHEIMEIKLLWV